MSRIILHSYVTDLPELYNPFHHFLVDIVEYDRLSILPLILESLLDTCLFLSLHLLEDINQDCISVRALEIDVVLMLVFQRLDGLVPQIHDGEDYSESGMIGRSLEPGAYVEKFEARSKEPPRSISHFDTQKGGSHRALNSDDLRH